MSDPAWIDEWKIISLNNRYSDALTRKDYPGIRSCYVQDATWESPAPLCVRLEGLDAIMSFNELVLGGLEFIIQMSSNHVVAVDGDTATLRSTVHEVARASDGQSGMNQYGIYTSTLRHVDGSWLFVARRFDMQLHDVAPPAGMAYAVA